MASLHRRDMRESLVDEYIGRVAINTLPEAEREPWRALWSKVEELRSNASKILGAVTKP
jgi:hypothetical protein